MASLNRVQLIGNLGRDPDIRYTPTGTAVANVSLATTDRWKDRDTGELKESTEWHRVVFFGRLAEIAGEHLVKGALLYIEGKLTTRKWQDKDGKDCFTSEIVAEQMQMLGGKPSHGAERQEPAPEKDDVPF